MLPPLKFAAIGLDHRHIYDQVQSLIDVGAQCVGFWTQGTPKTLEGFVKRFPHIPRVPDRARLLDDASIQLITCAAIPCDRAAHAIEAMRAGKDFMADKPGVTTFEQLDRVRAVQRETGRIYTVNFTERFEVRAVTRALELVRAGAIGDVVQTVGLGPHRLNRALRDPWFFDRAKYGGILVDIASHQIDQFLAFTRRGRRGHRARARGQRCASRRSGLRGLRRDRAVGGRRERLHPRRLVHARRIADLGRWPPVRHRDDRLDRASEVRRRRRAARARTTCSSSTAKARVTSTAATRSCRTTRTCGATSSSGPRRRCRTRTATRSASWR